MIMFCLLFTLLNPSIKDIDAQMPDDIAPVYFEAQENTEEELEFAESILIGHRRGDNNGYSADDMWWLYACVEAEEGGNSHRAKYLSACCIINRVRLGWAKTLTEAIFSPRQFEVVQNKRIYSAKPSEDTIRACNEAIDNPETWVIAFSLGNMHRKWAEVVEVVDGEYYYKQKVHN